MSLPTRIDFYFDFASPYSWLALHRLRELAATHGAAIAFVPFPVLDLMARVGNRPTSVESPPKLAYVHTDLARWAELYGLRLRLNPHMRQIDRRALLDGAAAALAAGEGEAYVQAVFRGLWTEGAAFASDAEIVALLDKGGVTGAGTIWSDRKAHAQTIDRNVELAVAAGVFGAPSFVVRDQLFFGNDRLDFVNKALTL